MYYYYMATSIYLYYEYYPIRMCYTHSQGFFFFFFFSFLFFIYCQKISFIPISSLHICRRFTFVNTDITRIMMRLAPKNENWSNYLRTYVNVFIFWSYPHYFSLSLSIYIYICVCVLPLFTYQIKKKKPNFFLRHLIYICI